MFYGNLSEKKQVVVETLQFHEVRQRRHDETRINCQKSRKIGEKHRESVQKIIFRNGRGGCIFVGG